MWEPPGDTLSLQAREGTFGWTTSCDNPQVVTSAPLVKAFSTEKHQRPV